MRFQGKVLNRRYFGFLKGHAHKNPNCIIYYYELRRTRGGVMQRKKEKKSNTDAIDRRDAADLCIYRYRKCKNKQGKKNFF